MLIMFKPICVHNSTQRRAANTLLLSRLYYVYGSWNISYGYDPNVCHTPILLTLEGHAHIDQNEKILSCTRCQCVRLFLLKTGICAFDFEICILLLVISNVQKEFYRKGCIRSHVNAHFQTYV